MGGVRIKFEYTKLEVAMSPTQAIKAAFVIVLASFLISCGGKDTVKVKSDLHIKGAPDWVNKGTQATAVPLNTIKKAWTLRFC